MSKDEDEKKVTTDLSYTNPGCTKVNAVDNEHGDEGEQELPEPDGDAYKTMKEQP